MAFIATSDAAFAASEGKKTDAVIGKEAAKAEATKAATPAPAANTPAPAGSVMVQLGAFGDSAKADTAWSAMTKRFGFLSGVRNRIAVVTNWIWSYFTLRFGVGLITGEKS